MTNAQEIMRMLRNNGRLPYGPARTAAAEMIARRVENEGPEEALVYSLTELVEAYTFGGEGLQAFVTFARLLRLWDERPELFDEQDTNTLFWEFKWIAGDLADYPQITVAQAEALLEDMGRRYALAGREGQAVKMSRFRWLATAGLPGAEEARLEWIRSASDELNDCAACVIGRQVGYVVRNGRFQEARDLGVTQTHSCNQEPTRTFFALALAQWNLGDGRAALQSYRAARASHRTERATEMATAHGQEFELLARGGHLDRALRHLREEYSSLLVHASSPLVRLEFLLGVLAGLVANHDQGSVPVLLTCVPASDVAELTQWVEREARALADQFDQRSGTGYYAERVHRALQATRGVELPFETEAADSPTVDSPQEETASEGGPWEQAERFAARRDYASASAAYAEAAALASGEGRLADAGIALAEAAECAQQMDDAEAASRLFAQASPLLEAGGVDRGVILRVWCRWARAACQIGAAEVILPRLLGAAAQDDTPTDSGADVDEALAERRAREARELRATVLDMLARSIAALPSGRTLASATPERALSAALEAGELFAGLGAVRDAAHAFWLAGRLKREAADLEGAQWALESAVEGFLLGGYRGEAAEAGGELVGLLRDTGQVEAADQLVERLVA